VKLIPLSSPLKINRFDIVSAILDYAEAANTTLQNGDVIVLSSKYVAVAEGRLINIEDVTPSSQALDYAETYNLSPVMAELVIQEADAILGGVQGFLLSVQDNVIAPNAGIDNSNAPHGQFVLYPQKPFASAERIRQALQTRLGISLGVIIADSRLMAGRSGTTGLTIGMAGFLPVVAGQAVADNLSAAAELLMGETDEGIPIVIVHDAPITATDKQLYTWHDLAIDYTLGVYTPIV